LLQSLLQCCCKTLNVYCRAQLSSCADQHLLQLSMLLGQGSFSLGHGQLPPQKLFCVWLCHDRWFLKMMKKDWKQPYYEFPLAHSSQLLKWNLTKSRNFFIARLAWNWPWIQEEYYYYEDETRLGIARNLRWRS
jgi:hypothetical protein